MASPDSAVAKAAARAALARDSNAVHAADADLLLALDKWVKPSLKKALAAFHRFRAKHPRRLFQIRLSPGMHDSGFVDYLEDPLVIGEGKYTGLRLRSWRPQPSPRNWDGLHMQSAEFVAVCGTCGVTSVTLQQGLQEVGARAFYVCRSLTSVILPIRILYCVNFFASLSLSLGGSTRDACFIFA